MNTRRLKMVRPEPLATEKNKFNWAVDRFLDGP